MRHTTSGRRSRNHGGRGSGGNNSGNSGGGGRRSHHQPRMKVYDSNGPDVRIRGTAHQVCEKYQLLAKDAASSGNIVLAESYLQHAEHYQRLINEFAEENAAYFQSQGGQQSNRENFGAPQSEAAVEGGDLSLPASILGMSSKPETQEQASFARVASEAVE